MLADVIVISKQGKGTKKSAMIIKENAEKTNKHAVIINASMMIKTSEEIRKNEKVLVIEDGPTLTHGGMSYGAGTVAAEKAGASIINAEKYAVGSIKKTFEKYSHLKKILPAMGYSKKQLKELKATIEKAPCKVIINASPADLEKLLKTKKKVINIKYEILLKEEKKLKTLISKTLKQKR